MRHGHYDQAHFNLAGEYNLARGRAILPLTLDEYCVMVDAFGELALTLDRIEAWASGRIYLWEEEIEDLLANIGE